MKYTCNTKFFWQINTEKCTIMKQIKEFYNQILGNEGLQTEFSGSIVSSNRELTYHFQLVDLTSNQQGHGNHKKMFQHQQSSHFGYHHP